MDGFVDKRIDKMREGIVRTLEEYGASLEQSVMSKLVAYAETEKQKAKKQLLMYGGVAVGILLYAIYTTRKVRR